MYVNIYSVGVMATVGREEVGDGNEDRNELTQFRFLHWAECYIGDIPAEQHNNFQMLCRRLLEDHTNDQYIRISEKIGAIAEKYGFTGWWHFWSPRVHKWNFIM